MMCSFNPHVCNGYVKKVRSHLYLYTNTEMILVAKDQLQKRGGDQQERFVSANERPLAYPAAPEV